jgi:hypothetical protein
VVGACVVWPDREPGGEATVLREAGRATLSSRGPHLADGCASGWSFGTDPDPDPDAATWLELLLDGGGRVVLGLWAPGYGLPEGSRRRAGWEVDVRIDTEGGPSYLLFEETQGNALFWAATGRDLDAVDDPDPLYLSEGRPVCRRSQDCGATRGLSMEVEFDDYRQEVLPHESFEVTRGPEWAPRRYGFAHAGYDRPADDACVDEAQVAVGFWRE